MPQIGDWIQIQYMEGEPQYSGKVGEVTRIDDMGQLHGTWGGLALVPGVDEFIMIQNPMNVFANGRENLKVRTIYKTYETIDGDTIYVPILEER